MQTKFPLSVDLQNAILNMYSKCSALLECESLFQEMQQSGKFDVITWNIMISAYANHGKATKALALLEDMAVKNIPRDEVTMVAALTACSHGSMLSEAKDLLATMHSKHHVSPTIKHYVCVVDALAREGLLDEVNLQQESLK